MFEIIDRFFAQVDIPKVDASNLRTKNGYCNNFSNGDAYFL